MKLFISMAKFHNREVEIKCRICQTKVQIRLLINNIEGNEKNQEDKGKLLKLKTKKFKIIISSFF